MFGQITNYIKKSLAKLWRKKIQIARLRMKQGSAWENDSSSKVLHQQAGGPELGPLAPHEKPAMVARVCNP